VGYEINAERAWQAGAAGSGVGEATLVAIE
jgi:hypothetical protein